MTRIEIYEDNLISTVLEILFTGLLIFVFTAFVFGQTEQTSQNTMPSKEVATAPKPVLQPVYTNYKGISIGSTAEEVKHKLGKAKIEDKDGFYYIFSDKEFAQIRLDENKKVSVLSITYSDNNKDAPKYEDVFGKDIAIVTNPDKSVYNLVRYPQAGMWIAYSSTAGDNPTITVTMQKM